MSSSNTIVTGMDPDVENHNAESRAAAEPKNPGVLGQMSNIEIERTGRKRPLQPIESSGCTSRVEQGRTTRIRLAKKRDAKPAASSSGSDPQSKGERAKASAPKKTGSAKQKGGVIY